MNKIFKTFLTLLILIPLLISLKNTAWAADMTVECRENGSWIDWTNDCQITAPAPNAALFNESDVKPGDNYEKQIQVTNNRTEVCNLTLKAQNIDDADSLSEVLKMTLVGVGGWQDTDKKTFWDFFNTPSISLGSISSGGSATYIWQVAVDTSLDDGVDPDTDSTYQGTSTRFDFDLNFECGAPEPSPSPSSVPGSPAPGSPTPGSPEPGSPGPDATTTTTSPLSSFIFGGPVGRFFADVLGIGEEPEESPEPEVAGVEERIPEVKGEATCNWWYYLWWLPLIAQGCLIFLYYYWLKDKQVTAWWLVPVLLAVVSQIIHEILGCECVTSRLCPWYWLFNLIILVNLTVYYLWRRQKKSSDLIEE